MSSKVESFDKRLGRVVRKHRAMSRGYTFRVDRSGLINIKPRRAKGTSPITLIVAVLMIGVLFKGVALANFGPAKYEERLAPMHAGNVAEQAAAWMLEPGKATYWAASLVSGIIR